MAMAMLRRKKKFENRATKWRPGWYYLHVGQAVMEKKYTETMAKTWRDAPEEKTLPKGAIYGMVLHGEAIPKHLVNDPWALGPFCLPILQTIEFPNPILNVTGGQSIWRIKPRHVEEARGIAVNTQRWWNGEVSMYSHLNERNLTYCEHFV